MKSCAAVITAMMLAFHVSAMAHEMTDMAARQPGAVTASAGIVYVPIREGSGRFPEIRDRVVVTYRGMFSDGKEFEKAEAVTFPLSGVITCWTLGIQYMKVGGKGSCTALRTRRTVRRVLRPLFPGMRRSFSR